MNIALRYLSFCCLSLFFTLFCFGLFGLVWFGFLFACVVLLYSVIICYLIVVVSCCYGSRLISLLLCVVCVLKIMLFSIRSFRFLIYSSPPHLCPLPFTFFSLLASYHHYLSVLYCTLLYCMYCMYCTVLYCTVLYCTVLYCTVLYCTVLYACNVFSFLLLTLCVSTHPFCSCKPTSPHPTVHFMFLRVYVPLLLHHLNVCTYLY